MKRIPLIDDFIKPIVGEDCFINHREELCKVVIGYILRVYNYVDFKSKTLFLNPAVRKNLRMKIREQAVLILNFKMAIILSVYDEGNTLDVFKACDVPIKNKFVMDYINDWGFSNKIKKKVKKKMLMLPSQIQKSCGNIILSLNSYMSRYVNRKLRFLYKSNNLSDTDIKGQLINNCIMCYYNEVPFKSDDFLKNTLKSKITSTGTNLIKFYKTKKRDRLVQQEDGTFLGTVVSINQGEDGDEYNLLDKTDAGENNGTSEFKDVRYKTSLNKLKYIYQKSNFDRKYQALSILSLEDNIKFISWYNENHRKALDSVEAIYDFEGANEFMQIVRSYFQASKRSWNAFIDEIKLGIGDI